MVGVNGSNSKGVRGCGAGVEREGEGYDSERQDQGP